MAALDLEILEPADGDVFVGAAPVHFRGRINSVPQPPATLFIKWYAGLEVPPRDAPSDTSIGTALDFTLPLTVGTQLIVFSAKDHEDDDVAALQSVVDAGFAGGERNATNPRGCAVHVARAESIQPKAAATLRRSSSDLVVVAPRKWDDAEYQRINRVRFLWRFEPLDSSSGLPSATLPEHPSVDVVPLSFNPSHPDAEGRPCVTYQGPLPSNLVDGSYRVVTRLEVFRRTQVGLVSDPAEGHEVSTHVVLVP